MRGNQKEFINKVLLDLPPAKSKNKTGKESKQGGTTKTTRKPERVGSPKVKQHRENR